MLSVAALVKGCKDGSPGQYPADAAVKRKGAGGTKVKVVAGGRKPEKDGFRVAPARLPEVVVLLDAGEYGQQAPECCRGQVPGAREPETEQEEPGAQGPGGQPAVGRNLLGGG